MITAQAKVKCGDVAAHYDDLDRFYREVWGEHVHHGLWSSGRETPEEATRSLIAVVAEQAALRPGDTVCDVGCGYGGTARVLAGEYGATVTALTVSRRSTRTPSPSTRPRPTRRTSCATGWRTAWPRSRSMR